LPNGASFELLFLLVKLVLGAEAGDKDVPRAAKTRHGDKWNLLEVRGLFNHL